MSQTLLSLTDFDLYLHGEGSHLRSFEKLGAQLIPQSAGGGVHFAVWAPNAKFVSVVGDFNDWARGADELKPRGNSGVWEGVVREASKGSCYKYYIESDKTFFHVEKADPYAFYAEQPPRTASVVWDLNSYDWQDSEYLSRRKTKKPLEEAMLIYEVHLGSWRRTPAGEVLSYAELARQLTEYVLDLGFTHVELMPVMEHPYDASWGYQTTSYFAPTSRFGTPDDFKNFVDILHQNGIGVLLDWTPAHFPADQHGLGFFDGTHLYGHADPKQGFHPDWGTLVFHYGRHEVANFLMSNALFWLEQYHIDGLRVDAVASMLYLDYSREAGEWVPNAQGGRENLDAISFIRRLNEATYKEHPDTFTVAEESTSWSMVSRPTSSGGLGFGFKWNMGWMNDTLRYFAHDPIHRAYHQNDLTFSMLYAYHENFILPISHDEVVHGKGSVLAKMPGDDWQKFANARLLYSYMYGHPGKKLLFMGQEFGQWSEWQHQQSLDWHLLMYYPHQGLQRLIRDLNSCVADEPALHTADCDPAGFEWIDSSDHAQSVFSFMRKSKDQKRHVVVVCNFTPSVRENYRVGVPFGGAWNEILNSDAECYGGSNVGNGGVLNAEAISIHGRSYSVNLKLPPLGVLFLKPSVGGNG